jgi:hypothetical protein
MANTTLIKIEITNKGKGKTRNVIDVVLDKHIDTEGFNAESYHALISDSEFLVKARQAIENADGWKWSYFSALDDTNWSLDEVKDCIGSGDDVIVSITEVGEKKLSFLSKVGFDPDGQKEFLKGTAYEAKVTDWSDDFYDIYDDCVDKDNRLALEYVLNYEG